jgi:hypothetical protein
MRVPDPLRPRVLAEDDGRVHLAFDDDRGARVIVVGLGSLAVGTLSLGWTFGWPWLGVLSVPAISVAALGLTTVVGRRTVEVHVEGGVLTADARAVRLVEVVEVRIEGHDVVLDHPDGPLRLALSGEEDEVREALRVFLSAR